MKTLTADEISLFINNSANTKIGASSKLKEDELKKVQYEIVSNFGLYKDQDLSLLISSFIKLNLVPSSLIQKVVSNDQITQF